jgi:hypothetical protein
LWNRRYYRNNHATEVAYVNSSRPNIPSYSTQVSLLTCYYFDCHQVVDVDFLSFPFRIVNVNNAFQKLTGSKSVIGETFFKSFVKEGTQAPSIAAWPTPLGKLEDISLEFRLAATNEDGLFCKMHVRPVMVNSEQPELGFSVTSTTTTTTTTTMSHLPLHRIQPQLTRENSPITAPLSPSLSD